jgi:benzoyl-CoA reductase/2-hydroxyglutaryl-CoA dehydratase subunit BcrC/BadD/HgdB
MTKVGFTTTIPQEYIWASLSQPIDLNNLFISGDSKGYIRIGEKIGVPRNTCSWIKGMMGVISSYTSEIEIIVAVSQGDCSNNASLMNLVNYYYPQIKVYFFSYPHDRDKQKLKDELTSLGNFLGVSENKVREIKEKLDKVRERLQLLDQLFYEKQNIPAKLYQNIMVSSSDFNSNINAYISRVEEIIEFSLKKEKQVFSFLLGYVGVPTIIKDIFDYLEEELKIKLVYFEVENEFAMLKKNDDIVEQYANFNYPYDLNTRINNIRKEISNRKINGIIHYVQTFCHRQIDDAIMQKSFDVPVLTIEGDSPDLLDMRTKIRIECFIERLRGNI